MLWWRHREPERELRTPREQLWDELKDFFVDEEGWQWAGPAVGFDDVATVDVERLWNHIASRATSIDDPHDIPDELGPLSAHEAVSLLLEGRLPYLTLRVRGLRPNGWVLPDLWLEVISDGLSLYWWVGHPEDNWHRETAAALADVLGEMWEMVPDARLECEYCEGDPLKFWRPIGTYRRATALASAPAVEPNAGRPSANNT
jgi:hypothetical protein